MDGLIFSLGGLPRQPLEPQVPVSLENCQFALPEQEPGSKSLLHENYKVLELKEFSTKPFNARYSLQESANDKSSLLLIMIYTSHCHIMQPNCCLDVGPVPLEEAARPPRGNFELRHEPELDESNGPLEVPVGPDLVDCCIANTDALMAKDVPRQEL